MISEKEIEELREWKRAVIDACTVIFYDVSSSEDPRDVVETLIKRNIDLAISLKPVERKEHEFLAYDQEDRRTLREIATTTPMTAEQHRSAGDRRTNARRQLEDRRMERELDRKFGE